MNRFQGDKFLYKSTVLDAINSSRYRDNKGKKGYLDYLYHLKSPDNWTS